MSKTPHCLYANRPPFKGKLSDWVIQNRAAETYARIEAELDAREDECSEVEYNQDERTTHHA